MSYDRDQANRNVKAMTRDDDNTYPGPAAKREWVRRNGPADDKPEFAGEKREFQSAAEVDYFFRKFFAATGVQFDLPVNRKNMLEYIDTLCESKVNFETLREASDYLLKNKRLMVVVPPPPPAPVLTQAEIDRRDEVIPPGGLSVFEDVSALLAKHVTGKMCADWDRRKKAYLKMVAERNKQV